MGQTVNYPNGQTLVSTALTVPQINILTQALTCGMLGINPVDPSQVRVDWQPQGQPDVALPSQDICYVTCVTEDVPYSRVRDHTFSAGDSLANETWVYTRGWRISWDLYGVNSLDRTRLVHSALFQDYFNDQFAVSNLYPVLDPAEPVRVPVEHNAQWYDHSHFNCVFYEQITETIQSPAVTSVEIIVYDTDGEVADITINK